MPIMKDDGSGNAAPPPSVSTDAGWKVIDDPDLNRVLGALILAVRDEINTIRTNGALGLSAYSVADWVTKINTKRTT